MSVQLSNPQTGKWPARSRDHHLVSDKVVGGLHAGGELNHGLSYCGHPVAAAVALENLRILRDEKIIQRVRLETGPYVRKRRRELANHRLLGEVRGVGMFGATELVQNQQARARSPAARSAGMVCRGHCFAKGLIMRAVDDSMMIAPPLVISKEELDKSVSEARRRLDLAAKERIV